MKSLKSITALLMLGASLACHAANESILEMTYAPGQLGGDAAIQPSGCALHFSRPADARKNKEALGTTFRDNPIMSKGPMTAWLADALGNMTRLGFAATVSDGAAPAAANTIQIATTLDKLYVWSHSMNLHSTLVVNATMKKDGGPEVQRHYRVISSKLNWANGNGEYIETMNLAANRLLEQMAEDARALCQGAKAS